MITARIAAPEIDGLVFGVMRAIVLRHGDTVRAIVADLGLDSMGPLAVFAEHLAAGPMPENLIALRLKYVWTNDAQRVFDELADRGLVIRTAGTLVAADGLAPLLDAIAHARAETAAYVWAEGAAQVEALLKPARQIALNASNEHELAVLYREISEPEEPPARLLRRLTCLRYVRHHCHAQAWQDQGLTGDLMPALTALWNGETTDTDAGPLIERGFAEGDPPMLTVMGQATRDRIELATDECTQVSFDALGPKTSETFLADLHRLGSER